MSNPSPSLLALKRSIFQRTSLIALSFIYISMLIYLVFSIYRTPCPALEGVTFRAVNGIQSFPTGTMHPSIAFRNGKFNWSVSDMLISGIYECKSGKIIASTSYNNMPQTVQLNLITGILLWNGETYKRTSEPARILGQDQKTPKINLPILVIGILIAIRIVAGGRSHVRR